MLIPIVGPSRSGKSTLISRVRPEFPSVRFVDLDAEENRAVASISAAGGDIGGWESRWERGMALLLDVELEPAHVIVDVGAGSLQTQQGRQFFIDRAKSMIAVVAPWRLVLTRHQGRGAEEFFNTEYSEERRAVYEAAARRVDTSGSIERSAADFNEAVRAIIQPRLSVTPP